MRRAVGVLAVLVLAVGSAYVGSRATAQAARAVTVSPNAQLIDGQWIDVGWTGFEPNGEIRVRLCPASAASLGDCHKDSESLAEAGDSRLERSGAQGQGSTPFVVQAKEVQRTSGGDPFRCDTESPCRLYVFELGPGGVEDAFDASAFTSLSYALSTITCPENEPRIAGSGATAARSAIVQWQAETCRPPHSLNVSYATSNSVNGKQAFVEGKSDADFAMSALELTAAERQALAARKVTPLNVPVALGSLVLVYNVWFDLDNDGNVEQVKDLQLSPATAARMLTGRLGSWDDAAIAADNPQHTFPPKAIVPVGRADNSAATWWLTSWFYATAKDAWEAAGDSFKGGPTTIFPAGSGGVVLRTGTDAVAAQVREGGSRGIPEAGLIGFVYLSEALKLGLPVAALRNPAGQYVKPTPEAISAAVSAGSISKEGAFTPNFATADPKAYPLPVVSSAIVPAGGEGGLDSKRAQALSTFLHYAVTDGQKEASLRGYVPLPSTLLTHSNASIAKIVGSPTAAGGTVTSPESPRAGTSPGGVAPSTEGTSGAVSSPGSAPYDGASGDVVDLSGPVGAIARALPAPVRRAVEGVIRLLDGGRSPLTVGNLLGGGIVVLVMGRVMAVVNARKRRRPRPAGARP